MKRKCEQLQHEKPAKKWKNAIEKADGSEKKNFTATEVQIKAHDRWARAKKNNAERFRSGVSRFR